MTIGQRLSEKRREMGKTIKDVEFILKIRSSYLEAMENDDFGKLPSLTYARAFLADYANYLGFDKGEIIEEFESLYLSRANNENVKSLKLTFPDWTGTFLALLIFAILFILGFYYLFSYIQSERLLTKPRIKSKQDLVIPDVPKEPPSSLKKPTPTENPVSPVKHKVTVKVRIIGKASWLRVLIDGKKVYEGVMRQYEENKWEGQEVTLRIGNPSSTEITVNGKVVKLGRSATGVIEKTFRGRASE